ncbi:MULTISPECIES: sulfotransferase family protein [Pseudomonas]|uniref:sulfotransferase family protein n=1 Tax=Pseudomonas TaxID=286 RepID=UPI002097E1B0|nr:MULTISPECIES: sulfotransferase [Pseudomonas]MBW8353552.1 sulfotransferase domain-containing protein [Pseudomonas sp.]MCO7578629.1 sulfotransferase domain-containing protein [Pseudomonas protegens]MCO7585381.1 sulfotransferase domain-containing protein [Pseudomonas chlororaphis]MCO7601803.1 sulfotransferase domain-containing protein [Pseudomonas chlororaphis]
MLKQYECMNVPDCVAGDGGFVSVVSGLPRSGTSMMMRALASAGLAPLTDNLRQGDERNPHGYFEWEAVKSRDGYLGWMDQARGRAVKLVSRFLQHLPATHGYRVLFMHRDIDAVIRSQRDMAEHHSGQVWGGQEVEELARLYREHVAQVLAWVRSRPNMQLLELDYQRVLQDPDGEFTRVAAFLSPLSLAVQSMAATVDRGLNHQAAMEAASHV